LAISSIAADRFICVHFANNAEELEWVDTKAKVWKCEMRIPLSALSETLPAAGTRWRVNLFRLDRANHAGLAWSPPLNGTFHMPERFGVLEFVE